MINLLPEYEKKLARDEYRLRVIAVSLTALIIAFAVGTVLLVPSYGLAIYKSKVAQNEAKSLIDTAPELSERELLTKNVDDVSSAVKALSVKTEVMQPTTIAALLVKNKTPDNKIISITYKKFDNSFRVDVKGVAKTRQSLQLFTSALEREKGVGSVNVPVSNFAKDTDIQFIFDISGKQ